MKRLFSIMILVLSTMVLLSSCGSGGGGSSDGSTNPAATYTVTYDGNGSTGGSDPIDSTKYQQGQTVTVLGNTGNLAWTGYAFVGWNTKADGSGTTYTQGQTFTIGAANVTLYCKWTTNPTYAVAYDGNGSTGGSVPVDTTHYQQGQIVTVLGNTGNLVNTNGTSFSFSGWNTQANGSGTTYTQGQTFAMGSAKVILYATWTAIPTFTVTYNGNGNTGGIVPVDSTHYQQGQTVTVLGNTGNLVKTDYSFTGWNTLADGSGITYPPTQTFTMGSAHVTLYAYWTPVKLVFVSSTLYSGDLGGIAGANAKCQLLAGAAGLPGIYKAWLSDSSGNSPKANFVRSNVPYVDVLGNVIANNWGDLVSGSLRYPIVHTQAGLITLFPIVWTFTNPDGTATMNIQENTCLLWPYDATHWYNDCDDSDIGHATGTTSWASIGVTGNCPTGTKPLLGDTGVMGSKTGTWSYAGPMLCFTVAHLYCFQQ